MAGTQWSPTPSSDVSLQQERKSPVRTVPPSWRRALFLTFPLDNSGRGQTLWYCGMGAGLKTWDQDLWVITYGESVYGRIDEHLSASVASWIK